MKGLFDMQDLDAFVRSLEGKTASELVELGKSFGNGGDETDDELMREMKCFERRKLGRCRREIQAGLVLHWHG